MKRILFAVVLLCALVFISGGLNSCRQNPLSVHDTLWLSGAGIDTAANFVVNGGFFYNDNSYGPFGSNEIYGWNPLLGTPLYSGMVNFEGSGSDGKPGFIEMSGNANPNSQDGIVQVLERPIEAGRRYSVAADITLAHVPNGIAIMPFIRYRFVASNDSGGSETIATFQTTSQTWKRYISAPWTAKASYNRLAITVENDSLNDSTLSWGHLDNVGLFAR